MECGMCGGGLFTTVFNGNDVAKCDRCGSIFYHPDIISGTKKTEDIQLELPFEEDLNE